GRACPGRRPPTPGERTTATRSAKVTPPIAVIRPQTGTFIRYSVTLDDQTEYNLRAIILVSEGDSLSGQDLLDNYISQSGALSIWAAVEADPTLGGVVSYAAVIEATAYGLMNFGGIDYLAAHFIVNIGT